ncbi:MAG: hypothetical protein AMXMBFR61_02920 [Fimbriimonadales bacterium]
MDKGDPEPTTGRGRGRLNHAVHDSRPDDSASVRQNWDADPSEAASLRGKGGPRDSASTARGVIRWRLPLTPTPPTPYTVMLSLSKHALAIRMVVSGARHAEPVEACCLQTRR